MEEQVMNKESIEELYKLLNDILDDYSVCKTDLIKSGIIKTYRVLLEKVNKEHLKHIEKLSRLEIELAEAKAKIPKTKEEISKLLNEAGFRELEECEAGTWHCQIYSDLKPEAYAELYNRYYESKSVTIGIKDDLIDEPDEISPSEIKACKTILEKMDLDEKNEMVNLEIQESKKSEEKEVSKEEKEIESKPVAKKTKKKVKKSSKKTTV